MKRFGDFTLDLANECLWQRGARIALQPKPFALLRYLVENPQRLISQRELLEKLWPGTHVQPQVLRTCVLGLRRILGDAAAQPRYIQTLPKRGYCFVAAVSNEFDAPPQTDEPQAGLPRRMRAVAPRRRRRELLLSRAHLLRLLRATARRPRGVLLRLALRRKV